MRLVIPLTTMLCWPNLLWCFSIRLYKLQYCSIYFSFQSLSATHPKQWNPTRWKYSEVAWRWWRFRRRNKHLQRKFNSANVESLSRNQVKHEKGFILNEFVRKCEKKKRKIALKFNSSNCKNNFKFEKIRVLQIISKADSKKALQVCKLYSWLNSFLFFNTAIIRITDSQNSKFILVDTFGTQNLNGQGSQILGVK